MKIIEQGGWANPWFQECRCSQKGCGATLLVEEKDLKPCGYKGTSAPFGKFTCPVCGHETTVSDLPPRLVQALDKKRISDYYD